MALDEPKESDQVFNESGLTFLIDKELFETAKPINVEFVETPRGSGFAITSALSNKEGSGCGSCSSC
ncbi:MAG: hypothetical protein A4E62_02272 [Syntrophorhabdus sp. PtaU1.Bin002]|nr:MAG: hypothetical protein A4E58_01730 [Syntrophorhabdus sp. PtaB.Bin006]OPY67448.1 MAG: hypothetical protein A4E62_02272 [Syntrophorhabdus sp. PtaU1.Bin002]